MPKLMIGDIRRGSKSRMRKWRKFTSGGTTSTVSGTMKSCPTLVWLFLNSAYRSGFLGTLRSKRAIGLAKRWRREKGRMAVTENCAETDQSYRLAPNGSGICQEL